MQSLLQDLRYGVRMLLKKPGFTLIAVLTLALGIGANTAIFSLVDAFVLRLLPVKDPQQLVFVRATLPNGRTRGSFSYPTFEQFRDLNHSFAGIFAWDDTQVSVTIDGRPEMVWGDFVSGSYFDVLGVNARLGRTFTAEDDRPGKEPVAVIIDAYWERRFARDPAAVGKTIYLNKIPFSVIGVLPPTFFGRNVAGRSANLVMPMFMQPQLALRDHNSFQIMARLKPGVSAEEARADLDVIYQQVQMQEAGTQMSPEVEQGIRARRIVLKSGIRGTADPNSDFAKELRILLAVTGLVLLIACINVANLLLASGAARRKEIAVRLSLGASRGRLIRQLLTESVLLTSIGGALGFLLAQWGVEGLAIVLSSGQDPIPFDLRPDVRILAFTGAVSLLTGLLLGLAPGLVDTRIDLTSMLKGSEGAAESRPLRRRMAKSLIVAQVALSLTLLVGAGLLIRSLHQLHDVDTGFERDKVLTMWVFPALIGYDHAKELGLYRQLHEKLNALPGVQAASVSRLALTRGLGLNFVGPRFFETLGIGLLEGREFSATDAETAPKVAVINESAARKFFPNENPLGRFLGADGPEINSVQPQPGGDIQIVGVVRDSKHHLRRREWDAVVYLPYTQAPPEWLGQIKLFVRTAGSPLSLIPTVRQEVYTIEQDLPLVGVQTQTEEMRGLLRAERSLATLLSFFGTLALVLAAVGLFGTMSYAVSRRTKELGIRMALGADRRDVLWLVMREALWQVLLGVTLGIPLALASTRLISSMLFGVQATDPLTLALVVLVMLAVAGVASYVPARRATKVDPMVALRYE